MQAQIRGAGHRGTRPWASLSGNDPYIWGRSGEILPLAWKAGCLRKECCNVGVHDNSRRGTYPLSRAFTGRFVSLKAVVTWKFGKRSTFCRNLNLNLKFYFQKHFCDCKFNAVFFKTSYLCPWEKIYYFEKDLSKSAHILRIFLFLVGFVFSIHFSTFPLFNALHFVEVMHWNVCWSMLDFLYQIWLVTISCAFNYSKLSMLKTVICLSFFKKM